MSIAVACPCGASYELKDEFAGRSLQCPKCGQVVKAGTTAIPSYENAAFERNKFLLRQKRVSINEKYHVWNEEGKPILFIERPAHLGRMLLAFIAGLVLFVVIGALAAAACFALSSRGHFTPLSAVVLILGLAIAAAAGLWLGVLLSVKRHVTFYVDDSRSQRILQILQDAKFQPINATYTICDAQGAVLARLRKNILYNFIRKRWYCTAPDGAFICTAKEVSIILSLIRRVLGSMQWLLRTNFIILRGDGKSEEIVGEFNRKLTLFDRYVLDLSADPRHSLDRRIALALGVMLDTGERR
jgi:uncharacterized protein YxjI